VNPIGMMQGRLSPPGDRPQSFPWSTWPAEFARAGRCGFDCIEWLFEARRYGENPIWTEAGVSRMRQVSRDAGVRILSLCADYFIGHPLHRGSSSMRAASLAVLETLLERSAEAGIGTIVLPVLEASAMRSDAEQSALLSALRGPLESAHRLGVRIALETEMPADDIRILLDRAGDSQLGVCYDIGNATAKGYDSASDILRLSPSLFGVHVKDRLRGGHSVSLGSGDVDFTATFQALATVRYEGPLILEAKSGVDYLRRARQYLAFVRSLLGESSRPTS